MNRPALDAVLDELADLIAARVAERIATRTEGAATAGLSVRDAAARLGVGVTSVRELIGRGSIRVTRIGRRIVVPASEVERVLEEGAASAEPASSGAAVVDLPSARAIEAARRAARRGGRE